VEGPKLHFVEYSSADPFRLKKTRDEGAADRESNTATVLNFATCSVTFGGKIDFRG
jgi:hypothetical protein